MAGARNSLTGAESAQALAVEALRSLSDRRANLDHPALYAGLDNPWTDQLARLVRDALNQRLIQTPDAESRHVMAAHWRFPSLLPDGPAAPGRNPLYDLAWRVYPADASCLAGQPLIAECAWRGGWAACAPACDRLAQGRATVKLLCAMADPDHAIGDMTLAQACAFRIAAFAPKGERVLLAFYGAPGSWRESAGFALYGYRTGDDVLQALD
jgi:hypothetical protein